MHCRTLLLCTISIVFSNSLFAQEKMSDFLDKLDGFLQSPFIEKVDFGEFYIKDWTKEKAKLAKEFTITNKILEKSDITDTKIVISTVKNDSLKMEYFMYGEKSNDRKFRGMEITGNRYKLKYGIYIGMEIKELLKVFPVDYDLNVDKDGKNYSFNGVSGMNEFQVKNSKLAKIKITPEP